MKQRDLQDAEARRFTVLRSRYYGRKQSLEDPRAITKFLAFYIAAEPIRQTLEISAIRPEQELAWRCCWTTKLP
jgi:hypothetical protein